jgi:hypothetical protein
MAKCQGFKNFKVRGVGRTSICGASRAPPLQSLQALGRFVRLRRRHRTRPPLSPRASQVNQLPPRQLIPLRRHPAPSPPTVTVPATPPAPSDFFAAYVVPENVWYILPARIVLKTNSNMLMLCPGRPAKRSDGNLYEIYLEACPSSAPSVGRADAPVRCL